MDGASAIYLGAASPMFGRTGCISSRALDSDRQCMLVMIGADEDGHKDILAVQDGFRENSDSWRDLLLDLKSRGLSAPCLAIGDGSLGFGGAT